MSTRINYDDIAHLYDDRRRDHPPDEGLAAFMAERGLDAGLVRVLDAGCGTGKQLAANRSRYERAHLVGVDRSLGMLRIARQRDPTVAYVHGDAQALPFDSNAFDYVTNQFSYPHIADKRRFAAEILRVLRPGGRFVLTNIDPWAMPGWSLYRYFPEARALDDHDFLPRASLVALLAETGFDSIDVSAVDRSQNEDLPGLLASAAKRHSASQLMAIPDAAYESGLRRLQEEVARGADPIRSDFVVLTVRAGKP